MSRACDWVEWTTAEAARRGDMKILEYAYLNGCELKTYAADCAERGGHAGVAAWIRANC